MQVPRSCFACCFLAALGAQAADSNPLGKVIELMDSLAAKVTQEGEVEAKAYQEFVEWCDDAAKNKHLEIDSATKAKEKLDAAISKTRTDAEASAEKVGSLAASIAADDADLKDATLIREKEAVDFTSSENELIDTVDTLGRAIDAISKEMAKNPAAFAQVDAANVDSLLNSLDQLVTAASLMTSDRQRLAALVQAQQGASADDDLVGAPAAATYKTKSGGILDLLEDLKEKAEEQLSALRKDEVSTRHNYELLKQSLEDKIGADTKDMQNEKALKAASEEAKAAAEADLATTTKDLANAKATLETVSGDCMTTAADHEATTAARTEELKVIAEAKKILTDTSAGAVGQTYSFLQTARGQARLGSRLRLQTGADLARVEVVTLVKRLALQHHSAALAQLASRIAAVAKFGASAGEDPFAKIKGLISDMISKLESEAESEATEKAYCDEQMAKTETKKSELEDDIAKLTSKIDKAAATSASLKEDVQELEAELASLTKTQAEMDRIRSETHANYEEAKADLELGLTGVRKALGVLRDYYGGGAAAALLQDEAGFNAAMQQPAKPVKHGKAIGAGQSIIGILEVVESDFAKNLAAEETQEADAAAEYEKTTQENKVTSTLKSQDVKYKTQESKSLDKSIAELSTDRTSMHTELSAVLEYYAKIKDRCVATPETYEERQKRRHAEIAGLKEALTVLNEETAFVQNRKGAGARSHFLGVQ